MLCHLERQEIGNGFLIFEGILEIYYNTVYVLVFEWLSFFTSPRPILLSHHEYKCMQPPYILGDGNFGLHSISVLTMQGQGITSQPHLCAFLSLSWIVIPSFSMQVVASWLKLFVLLGLSWIGAARKAERIAGIVLVKCCSACCGCVAITAAFVSFMSFSQCLFPVACIPLYSCYLFYLVCCLLAVSCCLWFSVVCYFLCAVSYSRLLGFTHSQRNHKGITRDVLHVCVTGDQVRFADPTVHTH